jgi:tetratricopeptide (TPR) repeat protein
LKLDISEDMLRHFGYDYWRQKNYEQAIRVFKLNVEKFPKSEETYHQLGDVYRDNGQLEIAIKTWEKGIEVAEENSNQPLINTLLQHIEDIKKELEKKKSEESENIPGSCSSYYC